MCEPVTVGLITAGIAAVGVYSQIQSAKAQEKALVEASRIQQEQIDDAASRDASIAARQMRAEAARIRVAAGEAGLNLASNSVLAQIHDSAMQAQLSITSINKNRKNLQRAREAETNSRIAAVNHPSYLQAGLQIAGAGLSGYSMAGGFNQPGATPGAA